MRALLLAIIIRFIFEFWNNEKIQDRTTSVADWLSTYGCYQITFWQNEDPGFDSQSANPIISMRKYESSIKGFKHNLISHNLINIRRLSLTGHSVYKTINLEVVSR